MDSFIIAQRDVLKSLMYVVKSSFLTIFSLSFALCGHSAVFLLPQTENYEPLILSKLTQLREPAVFLSPSGAVNNLEKTFSLKTVLLKSHPSMLIHINVCQEQFLLCLKLWID